MLLIILIMFMQFYRSMLNGFHAYLAQVQEPYLAQATSVTEPFQKFASDILFRITV